MNSIYQQQYFDLVRMIHLSLRAKYLFKYNLDYFIFDGEIVLIDRITGRMLPGTKASVWFTSSYRGSGKC